METLKLILPYMNEADSEELKDGAFDTLEKAVIAASKNGYTDVVRLLLPKVDRVGEICNVSWTVIGIAAARGYMDLLEFAADTADKGYFDEPRYERRGVLLRAIFGGHSAAANFLISRLYREWDLSEGLEKALVHGMDKVAECVYGVLMEPDRGISFSEFFFYLGYYGYVNALNCLYHRGQNEPVLVEDTFIDAAGSDQVDVLRLLLNTGSVSSESIDQGVWHAARLGRNTAVEFLISNASVSTRAISTAFEDSGSIATSKFLYYNKLDGPDESVMTAFRNAACCGRYTIMNNRDRIAILKFLCSTGLVPDELICEVFTAVIGEWYGGIVVLALCNQACISTDVIVEAFEKVAMKGSAAVVEVLLSKSCISLSVKEEALVIAAHNGRREALKRNCVSEDWSLDVLNKALTATSDTGALTIVEAKKAAKLKAFQATSAKC